ncbi:MAG: LPS export ABC transporter periplasmic protein LptC [Gemmatimonadetes bacterium]|nr:LPS export ABC transporter periplasmic protein LptC [Gemmatimonadota bacterium]
MAEAALVGLGCDQLMIGLEHYLASGGVRRARVVADTACFLDERATVQLLRVRVTFYELQGEESSTLTSDSASYDWMSGDMQARGNVLVVDSRTDRRVRTSMLRYERAREEIWSDQPATMTEPDGMVVEGAGFRASPGLDWVEMESARLTKPPGRASSAAPPSS